MRFRSLAKREVTRIGGTKKAAREMTLTTQSLVRRLLGRLITYLSAFLGCKGRGESRPLRRAMPARSNHSYKQSPFSCLRNERTVSSCSIKSFRVFLMARQMAGAMARQMSRHISRMPNDFTAPIRDQGVLIAGSKLAGIATRAIPLTTKIK